MIKPKIYISGKITGDPDYKAKFEAAADAYRENGYTVLTPSWMPLGMQPADYMRICFAMIDTADLVAFLPGYATSPGAQLELQYCYYIDKEIRLPNEFEDKSFTANALQTASDVNDKSPATLESQQNYAKMLRRFLRIN